LALREQTLRVCERTELRRMFAMKWEKQSDAGTKLHHQKLQNVCSLPNIITMIPVKEDKMGRTCSTHGAENAYRFRWDSHKEKDH
jgi:hypothetical protein